MTQLQDMLSSDHPDMPAIAAFLDGLDEASRRREALSLKRPQQRKLFDAANGFRAMTVEDMVPADVPAMHLAELFASRL